LKILHIDINHPSLIEQLSAEGYENHEDYTSSKSDIEKKINLYDGLVIRSRFTIDSSFLEKATNLKFIARVGSGTENIDAEIAFSKGIKLIAAPEGNSNAVGEHALGMLFALFNNLSKADSEVKKGLWLREENRGVELQGKTVGLIGYGNTGKAFAKKLSGLNVEVLCYDILSEVGDENATQVSLKELFEKTDVLSLHTPETSLTKKMIHSDFIKNFKKSFWFINTARGKSVVTKDLVDALKSGKILGAGLDVLEYEKSSFESLFNEHLIPNEYQYLIHSDKVILSPHIAGWTQESKLNLANTIVSKIKKLFNPNT
jgi:D-3-phosphoglycerate dehydrogenase